MSYRSLIVAAREMTDDQRSVLVSVRSIHQRTESFYSDIVRAMDDDDMDWDPVAFFHAVAMMDGARTTIQRLDQYLDECDPTLNTTPPTED